MTYRRATAAEVESSEKEHGEEEVDVLMQGVTFGELCNDFECISSPAVEQTALQLAKDIVELREEKRLLTCYGVYCNYKVWGTGQKRGVGAGWGGTFRAQKSQLSGSTQPFFFRNQSSLHLYT